MKNTAVLNPETGKIVYCAEWPAELKKEECPNSQWRIYQDEIRQSLANAIEFKDQEEIKKNIFLSLQEFMVEKWELEKLKPYEIPSELNVEIKAFCKACNNAGMRNCAHFDTCGAWKEFAFIKRQPKEPMCGDCGQELILVRPGKHQCDNDNCIQNRKRETQEDMIREITYTMVENLMTPVIGFETVKSKFRIERIK